MLTAAYINDHMKYIDSLSPEFGKSLAKLILQEAASNVGSDPVSDATMVTLNVKVSEVKALGCIDFSVNGFHIGHVGV